MPAPRMPILSVRAALLLTIVPFVAVAGRHLPAAPVTTSVATTTQVDLTSGESTFGSGKWDESGLHYQGLIDILSPPSRQPVRGPVKDSTSRPRRLVGSSPPSCFGKCGSCAPCTAFHTPINSSEADSGSTAGSLTQLEYYPEVWRCKCSNHLYAP